MPGLRGSRRRNHRKVGLFRRPPRWCPMTGSRRPTCGLWIVLAAIGGVLSVVDEASACGSAASCQSSITCCCALPPAPEGAYQGHMGSISQVEGFERLLSTLASGSGLGIPANPCVCFRAGDPAAPSPLPASRVSQDRSDEACSAGILLVARARPVVTFVRLFPPTGSSPKTPLYLRHAHLLI